MSNLTVNSMVKINPTVFGTTPKLEDMYGDLGYPGVFAHITWQIVRTENDATRGQIAYAKILNADALTSLVPGAKRTETEGEAALLMKDLVPASMKTTIDYIIESEDSVKNEAAIKALFAARKKMQNQGKGKEDSNMKKNWREITKLRSEGKSEKVSVILPKQKLRFELNRSELPTEDEKSVDQFKMMLANKLRGARNAIKQHSEKNTTNVDVFGVSVKKSGGVFLEQGSLLKAYEESLKTSLETPKKPIDPKANYVGVEIEFIYAGNYDMLKKLLIAQKLHRYVDLTSDGSLRPCHNNGTYQTLEMRVICKNTEIASVMAKLHTVFNNPRVDAYVNRTCGLHVHVDMRNRDVSLVYRNLVRVQNLLRGAQPVGRVNNTHCKPNTTDKFPKTEDEGRNPRYSVINSQSYQKHQTLEVRIHEGTVNCADIANWVTFIDSLASHTTEIPVNKLTKASQLVETYAVSIPAASINYVDSRIEKFDSLAVG